jgi:hypothetical protein
MILALALVIRPSLHENQESDDLITHRPVSDG